MKTNKELLNLLNTIDYDKKLAVYSGIAVYLVNTQEDFKDYINKVGNRKPVMVLDTLAYELNEVVILDIPLFKSVCMRWIESKRRYLDISTSMIMDDNLSIGDVLGVTETLGNLMEIVDAKSKYFRLAYRYYENFKNNLN